MSSKKEDILPGPHQASILAPGGNARNTLFYAKMDNRALER